VSLLALYLKNAYMNVRVQFWWSETPRFSQSNPGFFDTERTTVILFPFFLVAYSIPILFSVPKLLK
jgi:hypothetical protein